MIFGIDPSLTATAVCFGNDPDPEKHEIKLFGNESRGPLLPGRIQRVYDLALMVEAEIARNAEGDDSIFIEAYSYGSQNNREKLAEYGGILRMLLLEITPNIFEVAPTTLKKFATGKGKGKKHAIAGAVGKRFGLVFDSDDETDAFCLWRFGIVFNQLDSNALAYEKDSVNSFRERLEK